MRPLLCPSCRGDLAITDLRPGRFRIACPRCAAPLLVAVPDDPTGAIDVELEAVPASGSASVPASAVVPAPPVEQAIRSGWFGRYRMVAGQGRAAGIGPKVDLIPTRERWRADARFVAAWTLEALSTSVLRHPNLATPIGIEVAGDRIAAVGPAGSAPTLADPSARSNLDRQARVAAVLHAARGLKAAHEQQVYHRDLSLGSIRLEADGLVRVAGLGVGLTPGLNGPQGGGESAALTDIAGLGRILSTLVAGSAGDRAVLPGLASLIRRLGGGDGDAPVDPRERLPEMGAVVRALEAEQGVGGPLVATDADAATFEAAVQAFETAPLAAVGRWVGRGANLLLALIVVGLLAVGWIAAAIGWLGFGGLVGSALAGFRIWDARRRIGARFGLLAAAVERGDLIGVGVAAGVGLLLAGIAGWLAVGIVVLLGAIGLAATFHFGLERPLIASRAEALDQLRGLIRGWRRAGWDEEAIRRYVATGGGPGWEELFAAIFGVAAVAPARERWGTNLAGQRRPRFAPVRAWLIAQGDGLVTRRLDERTRGWLEPIIERDLEAGGLHVLTARRRSKRAAAAVVAVLDQFRRSPEASVGLPLVEALRRAVDQTEAVLASPEIAEAARSAPPWTAVGSILIAPFGRWSRFALGLACLAGSVIWMERNELYRYDSLRDALTTSTVDGNQNEARALVARIGADFVHGVERLRTQEEPPEPLQMGVLPLAFARKLDGFALLGAGLILIASCLGRSTRIIPFALIAALVPLAPHLVLAGVRPLSFAALASLLVGVAILAVGISTGRREEIAAD